MKTTLRHLAQAFVDASEKLSPAEQAKMADAVMEKIRSERIGSIQNFLRAVSLVLRQRQRQFHVESATELSDARMASLTQTVEKAVSASVRTFMKQDPALIGGVIAQVGDERFDASALSMLQHAAESLLVPLR